MLPSNFSDENVNLNCDCEQSTLFPPASTSEKRKMQQKHHGTVSFDFCIILDPGRKEGLLTIILFSIMGMQCMQRAPSTVFCMHCAPMTYCLRKVSNQIETCHFTNCAVVVTGVVTSTFSYNIWLKMMIAWDSCFCKTLLESSFLILDNHWLLPGFLSSMNHRFLSFLK